jgi:hypothetical protein
MVGANSRRAPVSAALPIIFEEADTLRRIDLVWLDNLPEATPLRAAMKRDARALREWCRRECRPRARSS